MGSSESVSESSRQVSESVNDLFKGEDGRCDLSFLDQFLETQIKEINLLLVPRGAEELVDHARQSADAYADNVQGGMQRLGVKLAIDQLQQFIKGFTNEHRLHIVAGGNNGLSLVLVFGPKGLKVQTDPRYYSRILKNCKQNANEHSIKELMFRSGLKWRDVKDVIYELQDEKYHTFTHNGKHYIEELAGKLD